MAKWCLSTILDQALSYIANNATQMIVCSAQPTTYAEATTTYKLAAKTGMTSGSFTGPAAGDTNGRKLTVNAQAGVSATATGTGTHIALCSGAALLYVTTMTSQAITDGNTVNIPAWDVEISDPV